MSRIFAAAGFSAICSSTFLLLPLLPLLLLFPRARAIHIDAL
jgi:hypothetical protein